MEADTIWGLAHPSTAPKISIWSTLLGVALMGVAVFVLHHLLGQYHWRDILLRVHAISNAKVLRAAFFTCAGYGCLTLYDALAVHFAGAKVPYPRIALISFMGYAIGHNVGLNSISGGAIRYRAYTALGLSGKQIATIIAFGTLTFFLGASVLLGMSLLSNARMSGSILHVPAWVAIAGGAALLTGVACYLWLVYTRHGPLRFRRFEIPVPKPKVAFAQIGVSCVDMLFACSVLFVLLPREASMSFFTFAGVYLIALAAGAISNVPGGIGVFEFVLILLLPAVPKDRLLGALVAYRAIYYFAPFGLALLLLGAHEVWIHRGPVVRWARLARTFLTAVTPQAIAISVFLAGAVLLFSGATPALGSRLALLRDFVPLPVLELSHLLGSVVGVGLLIIAHGLYRRLHTAWWITIWLLCAGILVSLLKGFDYEEAGILGLVVILLTSARTRFRRRASLIEQHYSSAWVVAFFLVLFTAGWLVIFAYRHLPYDRELWWQFAFQASAPRSLRASLLAVIFAAAYGLWRVLRPAPPRFSAPREADLERAAELIAQGEDTTANLALLGDKNLLFNKDRTACIMYQSSGSSWVAMGDPIGPAELGEALAWEFLEDCDGATFEMIPRGGVTAILPELRAVSDAWLAEKNTAEKRFSLGYFDERYIAHFDVGVVRHHGAVVAFANLWRGGSLELSVDLMRYNAAAPKGVVDFMLIECMLWGRAQGFRWFNLGMAPLSGLEEHALAPAWHKLGRMVQRYGENFYSFEGLRKFKEKFDPVWRPRYLAAPGGLAIAGALLDVTALISGGVRNVLRK
jgi:phosphatidylglycerol lysyltransferase